VKTNFKQLKKRSLKWSRSMNNLRKTKLFILLTNTIKSTRFSETIWTPILRDHKCKSCFWEKAKVSTNLDKKECTSRLKRVIKFLWELVEDTCTLMSSLHSTLILRSKRFKEEMCLQDSRTNQQFRTFQLINQCIKRKQAQLDHQERQVLEKKSAQEKTGVLTNQWDKVHPKRDHQVLKDKFTKTYMFDFVN